MISKWDFFHIYLLLKLIQETDPNLLISYLLRLGNKYNQVINIRKNAEG
jgi:hypothetical protein